MCMFMQDQLEGPDMFMWPTWHPGAMLSERTSQVRHELGVTDSTHRGRHPVLFALRSLFYLNGYMPIHDHGYIFEAF